MSKIILEAFRVNNDQTKNILTREILHLKEISGVPYLYAGPKRIYKVQTSDGGYLTTTAPNEATNLNIQALEISVLS